MKKKNVTVEYEWCQYTNDVEDGLFTVTKLTREDHIKVHSQSEAIWWRDKLNKETNSPARAFITEEEPITAGFELVDAYVPSGETCHPDSPHCSRLIFERKPK